MKNKKLLFIGVLTAFLMLAVPFAVVSFDAEDVDATGDYVAEVGDAGYLTLKGAIDAAESGDTIKILKDFSSNETITISKDLKIDGNDKKITFNLDTDYYYKAIDIFNNEKAIDVSISDLKIESLGVRGINFYKQGKLTLTDIEVNAKYGLYLPGGAIGSVVEIYGSTFTGIEPLNTYGKDSHVIAYDSHFISTDKSEVESYFAIGLLNDNKNAASNALIEIYGGSVIATDENDQPSVAVKIESVPGTVVISETTKVVGFEVEAIAIQTYVEQDSYYSFSSLQGFVEWANKEGTNRPGHITLLKDVVLEENLVIDGSISIDGAGKYSLIVPEGVAIGVKTGQSLTLSNITLNNEGMVFSEGTVTFSDGAHSDGYGVFSGTGFAGLDSDDVKEPTSMENKTEFSGEGSVVIEGNNTPQEDEVTFDIGVNNGNVAVVFPEGSKFDVVSSVSATEWNSYIEGYNDVYDIKFYGIDSGDGDILITIPRTSMDGIVSVKNIDEDGKVLERMEIVDITKDYITFKTTHNSLYAVSYTQFGSGNVDYYPDDDMDTNIIYIAEIVLIALALIGLAAIIRRN